MGLIHGQRHLSDQRIGKQYLLSPNLCCPLNQIEATFRKGLLHQLTDLSVMHGFRKIIGLSCFMQG